jgi:Niemann-Pick C1 protein
LILAIGVDNMFIIVGTKERIKAQNVAHLMGLTMKEVKNFIIKVGPSITTAAFSECLAFAVGYMTNIPALQSFCLAATFAVLVDYFLQMTVFVAFVTFDEMRIRDKRYDILPCIKAAEVTPPEKESWLTKFLSGSYFDFISLFPMKVIIILIYIGLIVCSIFGLKYIPLGLNQMVSVIQGNNLYNYFDLQYKYGEVGPPAYLVLYNIDYNNQTNLQIIDDLSDQLSQLTSVKPPVYSWYKDFKKFMDRNYLDTYEKVCNPELDYIKTLPMDMQIKKFLEVKIDSDCCTKNALCGEQYVYDINFNEEGIIDATRLRFQHVALSNQSVYIDSFIQTRKVVKRFSDKFALMKNTSNKHKINSKEVEIEAAFPYSLFYVYYDQYTFIQGISLMNVIIALLAIFTAVQLIMNVKSAFIVTEYLH